MADANAARLDLAELLAAVEAAPPVDAADVVGAALADALGACDVSFLITDFSGRKLVRLGHRGSEAADQTKGRETGEHVLLAGSAYGRVLVEQAVAVEEDDDGARLLAPVTHRGEAIGVLEVHLAAAPDEQAMADVALAAHALAYVVIANRGITDLFEWGRRSIPLTLAAEIQHRLLPDAFTLEAGQFTLAAWLEPAGQVGGDTFDFAAERDTLHLSLTDAMGHMVNAAVLATVFVGALRNARRRGVGLVEQVRTANQRLGDFTQTGGFVTGQVVRVDLAQASMTLVNAGHPPPLRLRDGRVERLPLQADPPFGTVGDPEYRVQETLLEPGDRLLFVTDGMLERTAASVDVEALVLEGAQMHPREAVQQIIHAVLEATEGKLEDDATALCLDWHGAPPAANAAR